MVTVHLVFNAHIDPVWLWPWQSGVDALLSTCRSACDRLDRHQDLHFTRGEAWAYNEIERIDPALFERIREYIRAGRWHVGNGWWIQPDCNGPSAFGLDQQIKLGKEYCLARFGFFPRTAYNADSFGHAASLPGLLRANGQDRYVFMRPQE
ncbi:MAG: alpha-mannosidase, partial [Phycisphaerae bacterium]